MRTLRLGGDCRDLPKMMEEVGTVGDRGPSPEGRCLPCEETRASGQTHERLRVSVVLYARVFMCVPAWGQ